MLQSLQQSCTLPVTHRSFQNPDDPDRIDLEDRPHATIGKATKFGATAVCSATSWTPNGPLRFASGGCGSADKTVRLWTITTEQHSSRLQATIVRLPPQHTAAVHALGHMTSKEYILSAGPDNHLIVTDVRAERVVHANIVEETRNEVSQFHVATPSSSGHELVLCEVSIVDLCDVLVRLRSDCAAPFF